MSQKKKTKPYLKDNGQLRPKLKMQTDVSHWHSHTKKNTHYSLE